jgi:hypothetical protein
MIRSEKPSRFKSPAVATEAPSRAPAWLLSVLQRGLDDGPVDAPM